MTTYAIIAGVLALVGALAYVVMRRAAARNKELGRQEVINEVDRVTIDATRKADAVLNEHRTVSDTAGKLRNGSF